MMNSMQGRPSRLLGQRAWQNCEGAQHICFQFLLNLQLLLLLLAHLQEEVQGEGLLQVLLHLLLPEVEVEVKGEVAEGDMQ